MKFFGFDKSKPADYQSGRDADSIVTYALEKIPSEVKKRMKGKTGSDKSSKKSSDSKQQETFTDGDVVILTKSNFED